MSDNRFAPASGNQPARRVRQGGVAEAPAPYDPGTPTLQESAMIKEINAILDRLRVGIPRLHQEMDDLLARIGRPAAA